MVRNSSSSTNNINNSLHAVAKHIKLELPKFVRGDPIRRLFKATQFFNYHNVLVVERMKLPSFALEVDDYD